MSLDLGLLTDVALKLRRRRRSWPLIPPRGGDPPPSVGLWSFGLCGLFGELRCDASFGSFGLRHCRSGGSGGTPTQDIHAL